MRLVIVQEDSVIAAKSSTATFAGSFFSMNDLPRDGRTQIAVAGRSNVGKSTLLNHLLGNRKLAKVSSTPGKTRSLNFFLVDEKFYLVDLPGYGYAKASRTEQKAWGQLVEDYLANCEELDGMILLIDCRREPTPEDRQLVDWLAKRQLPVIIAVTKADKLNHDKLNRKVRQLETEFGCSAIPTSAQAGLGKRELMNAVRNLISKHANNIKAKWNE